LVAVFEDTGASTLLGATVNNFAVLVITVGKTLEPEFVGENVKGDVDPFVVTQP
jgi:hypothetical protein